MAKFCGNCGVELENNAKVCGNCGTPLFEKTGKIDGVEYKPRKKKQKQGKKHIWVLAILCCVLFLFAGVNIFTYIKSMPSKEEIRIASNNLQNGGLAATDGKWLFYNGEYLSRERLADGSKKSIVSSDMNSGQILFLGDSLYYYTTFTYYKLKNGDNTNSEDLGFNALTEDCIQFDGKHYFVTGSGNYEEVGIYSVKSNDIQNATKISEIYPSQILSDGNYLYVVSEYNLIDGIENQYYGTWRLEKDGSNPMKLLDYCPGYMVFASDTIYFMDKERILWAMKNDGSAKQKYDEVYVGNGLNVTEDYVFYIDKETEYIYRMNADGSNQLQLNSDRSERINIAGEWLVYVSLEQDFSLKKLKFDGTENMLVE